MRRFARELGEHLDDLLCLARADITTKRPEKKRRGLQQIEELQQRIGQLAAEDALRPPASDRHRRRDHEGVRPPPFAQGSATSSGSSRTIVDSGEVAPHQEADVYVEFLRANRERFGI